LDNRRVAKITDRDEHHRDQRVNGPDVEPPRRVSQSASPRRIQYRFHQPPPAHRFTCSTSAEYESV
jgi:hypothetical protein